MSRSFSLALLLATSVAAASLARTQPTAAAEPTHDLVADGRAFAGKVCWTCHIVAKDQTEKPILTHPAPSFEQIAQRPGLSAASLRSFLATHNETMGSAGRMPNPRLVDYQIDEVAAYILSLRK